MINDKLRSLVSTGQTFDENGERVTVTNKQMAQMKLDSAKARLQRRPQLIADLVVIKHKTKVTPYGCFVFDVVPSSAAITLCDKKPHEWERYQIAPEPVGMEEAAPKRSHKKMTTNDDV